MLVLLREDSEGSAIPDSRLVDTTKRHFVAFGTTRFVERGCRRWSSPLTAVTANDSYASPNAWESFSFRPRDPGLSS